MCVCVLFITNYESLFFTFRGENCLHVLARYSKENAAEIFSLLMHTASGFPIDVQDRDGNTGE